MNTSNKPILIALGFVVAVGVIGSVVSPANIVSILGFCGVVTVSLVGLVKANDTSDKVAEAANKVAEVKVDLAKTSASTDEKLEKIEQTGEKVHTLVNSNMGVQLRLNAALSGRLADITKDPQDMKAAELARSLLHEHEEKQAVVDQKSKA